MNDVFVQELNGIMLETSDLPVLMALQYGHFTSMQIRDGQVKGLKLHLDRLEKSSEKLFACHIDGKKIMEYLQNIVGKNDSCSVRVNIFTQSFQGNLIKPNDLKVLITKSSPVHPSNVALKVKTAHFERLLPDVKYSGILSGILAYQREARAEGYNDVLYTDNHDHIAEGSVWNIGFYDGQSVILPTAPALSGIMIQLLTERFKSLGTKVIYKNIHLSELSEYKAAFYTNSVNHRGIIAQIDRYVLDKGGEGISTLLESAYDGISWDRIHQCY
jgi:branched-subunit amino acid aminotransferase/4-amino-4-deoxychorismate lyase